MGALLVLQAQKVDAQYILQAQMVTIQQGLQSQMVGAHYILGLRGKHLDHQIINVVLASMCQ